MILPGLVWDLVNFVCAWVRHAFWWIWPKVRQQFGGSISSPCSWFIGVGVGIGIGIDSPEVIVGLGALRHGCPFDSDSDPDPETRVLTK
jgi:hypothetical protein